MPLWFPALLGQTPHLMPVNFDLFQVLTRCGYQRLKRQVLLPFPSDKQLLVVEILNSWTERKSQQMHRGKDMSCEPRSIGVMLPDFLVVFVVQQAIEQMSYSLTRLIMRG